MTLPSARTRFLFSVGAALVVAVLTWRSIDGARRAGSNGPTATVLVLRKPAPVGQVVDAADIETRVIPASFAEPGAFHDPKDARGARARIALVKGEQLTRSKIESAASRLGLAWSLTPGSVALSLRLPSENAVGGHALPGDWVAVVAAGSPLVARARVVAVQDRVWDPAGAPPSPFGASTPNESLLITLMLTPDQVSRVAAAVERGRITLALLSALNDERGG